MMWLILVNRNASIQCEVDMYYPEGNQLKVRRVIALTDVDNPNYIARGALGHNSTIELSGGELHESWRATSHGVPFGLRYP